MGWEARKKGSVRICFFGLLVYGAGILCPMYICTLPSGISGLEKPFISIPMSLYAFWMLTAHAGAFIWSWTAIKNPFPVPPAAKRSVASGQPDFLKISTICFARPNESVSLAVHHTSIGPDGAPVRAVIRTFSCSGEIVRSFKLSFSLSNARSAVAARSCCLASSISTFCCDALASVASFWSPATFPLSALKSLRSNRLSCSKFLERSSARAAVLFASSIRALASAWMASCSLFPESQTSHVNSAITSAVTTRTTIDAAKSLACRFAAASITDPACVIAIAIIVFAIGAAILATVATRENGKLGHCQRSE